MSDPLTITKKQLSSRPASKPVSTSQTLGQTQVAEASSVEIMKHFYQEQIDRLNNKNEQVLRENERLRVELLQFRHISAQNRRLRQHVAEVELKNEELLEQLRLEGKFSGVYLSRPDSQEFKHATSSPTDSKLLIERRRGLSRSKSHSSRGKEEVYYSSPRVDFTDDYARLSRKIVSENVSIDDRDHFDKEPTYLREFLGKLKSAAYGKLGSTMNKQQNSHKKTNSLALNTAMQGKEEGNSTNICISNEA